MKLVILAAVLSLGQCDQLSDLISYLAGGPNPAAGREGPGVSRGGSPHALGSGFVHNQAPVQSSRRAPSVNVVSPVPFSEPADPARGRVQLDVPQPKQNQGIGARTVSQMKAASTPQTFFGLPAGSTQVSGRPVSLAPRERKRPVSLDKIEVPVFLSETFRSPLNDVNPSRSALQEPVDALRHNFPPGGRPRAQPVTNENLPVIAVLNLDSTQRNIHENRLSYENFASDVFPPNSGHHLPQPRNQLNQNRNQFSQNRNQNRNQFSQNRNQNRNQFSQNRIQFSQNRDDLDEEENKLTHQEALQKHREEVKRVEQEQQQFQLQSFQHQAQLPQQLPQQFPQQLPQPQQQQTQQQPLTPQQLQQQQIKQLQELHQQQLQQIQQQQPQPQQHAHPQHNPLQQPSQKTHFTVPGHDQLRQYEQELRLAQEALKKLG